MKISVVIITYNRREDLRRTIEAYSNQTHPNKEIIVIDNASIDGTKEMMLKDFPDISYQWLPNNFDIRAINIGIEKSDGDIIWRTDDDSFPEDPNAFKKVVDIFENHKDIHIISTEDIEVLKGNMVWEWYPFEVDKQNIPERGYPAIIFPGTGAGIRREVYDKIGGFWEFGFEELDFCTRAIANGFEVRYFPNIRTLHYASPGGRISGTRWVKISTQYIRYQIKYFPLPRALGRSFMIYWMQILQGIFKRVPISALFEGIFAMVAVVFKTYRDEKMTLDDETLKKVTLGQSILRNQLQYMREVFKNLYKKFKE